MRWLLAVLVVAQAVFAGLVLDGNAALRAWHAATGMLLLALLALVEVGLAVLVHPTPPPHHLGVSHEEGRRGPR